MERLSIRVYPAEEGRRLSRLLGALRDAFPVEFELCHTTSALSGRTAILLRSDESTQAWITAHPQSTHYAILAPPRLGQKSQPARIQFAELPESGLNLTQFHLDETAVPLVSPGDKTAPGHTVAATTSGIPLWTWSRGPHHLQYHVAYPLVDLQENQILRDHLRPGNAARLLPLVHFLRKLTDPAGFRFPSRLACIALDDPNLHWPSYGYVDFKNLIAHAQAGRYHVAVAMVPLDAWWAHPRARELFQKHPQDISLMVHGNDHTHLELGRDLPLPQALAMMAQALRRVDRFEERTGLTVTRVMEPPHGVCSRSSAMAMEQLGFAGALLTHERVLDCNQRNQWPAHFGLRPLDMVGSYFPLLARSRWSEHWSQSIPISALLDQPLIVATHHEDATGDFKNFDAIAARIRSIGDVQWADFETMSRHLYQSRVQDGILYVRPFSRTLTVRRPPDAEAIAVLPPSADGDWGVGATRQSKPEPGALLDATAERPLPLGRVQEVWVNAYERPALDYTLQPTPAAGVWPPLRRFLASWRDRFKPIVPQAGENAGGALNSPHPNRTVA